MENHEEVLGYSLERVLMHMKGMERTLGNLDKKGGARRILTSAKDAIQGS